MSHPTPPRLLCHFTPSLRRPSLRGPSLRRPSLRKLALWGLGSLSLGLAACSSGGGSGPAATSGTSAAPATSAAVATSASNRAPLVQLPAQVAVDEGQTLRLQVPVSDPEGDPLRVFLLGRPPGASWDEARRELVFRPDFLQSGRYSLEVLATDGVNEVRSSCELEVRDAIRPPAPRVLAREAGAGFTRLVIEQPTDAFLAGPRRAGQTFQAIVCVPDGASAGSPLPVRLSLHGFNGSPWREGWSGEFRIAPHDPENTYWWGYGDELAPGASQGPRAGRVEPYTQRRALHLLGWVLETYPGADAERVYVEGASMGGAGAAALGLLRARHFCWISATYGQTIARNHRPSRLAQLSSLWGSPNLNLPDETGAGVWDRLDLSEALTRSAEARDAFLFLHHAKDDGIIHFGAVAQPSSRTRLSFYEALQEARVGHYAIWDEGGHVSADPHLPAGWWDGGWNPVFDPTASLRRDQSFPAFSRSQLDDDPGDGQGNGRVAWSAESGYAADPSLLDDTGWAGDRAGARNRFLRWDATRLVDTPARWALPLRVLSGPGGAPPRAGDPTLGDQPPAARARAVDVTPRRVQAFTCLPHERVRWRFGSTSGVLQADAEGSVTVPALVLREQWETLELTRLP